MVDFYQHLGRMIRGVRERKGITQSELASRIGLNRTSVSNFEAGRQRFSAQTLARIAAALGVSLESLVPTDPALANDRSMSAEGRWMSTVKKSKSTRRATT